MASTQEVEMLRRQLDELTAQMIEIRQQHLAKTLTTGTLLLTDSLDPAYPALLKTARQSPTVVMATPPHEQLSATLLYLLTMLTRKGARKVARKAGNNGFEAYRQLCLMYGTSDQVGSTGLFVQIMSYKFSSKNEDVEDRLNEFLELVRRHDEANGTDPVPDQVKKKACIISNTPEALKTHLQLNVAQLGNFNAFTRGNGGLLEEQTHLQDGFSRKHTR